MTRVPEAGAKAGIGEVGVKGFLRWFLCAKAVPMWLDHSFLLFCFGGKKEVEKPCFLASCVGICGRHFAKNKGVTSHVI